MISKLRALFAKADSQQQITAIRDVYELVEFLADDESVELNHSYYQEVMQRLGLTLKDIELTVEEYERRRRLKVLADQEPELRATAERLEKELRAADLAEGERHAAEVRKLRALADGLQLS